VTGFASEQVFIKRLLKKLKVTLNVFSREQYKNVHNDVLKTRHPPPVRQAIRTMLQLQLEQVVEGVAKDKGLSFSQVSFCYCSQILCCSSGCQCVRLHVLVPVWLPCVPQSDCPPV